MCGFLSIFAPPGNNVLEDILDGLLAIQHRGQDAAGVVTYDGTRLRAKKGLGLVSEVFGSKHIERLIGHQGVGHVRYPTVGANEDVDVQPFWIDYPFGLAMSHNGNVTNFFELKTQYFPARDINLSSNCDLEAILLVMANALMARPGQRDIEAEDIFAAVAEVFETVRGAYSVVGFLAGKGMFAFRDPYGIKPIILGSRKDARGVAHAVASESVVLDVIGYEDLQDLQAGEVLWIDRERSVRRRQVTRAVHRPCIFEYVYFARPDSFLDDISVHKTRLRLGEAIAREWLATGLEADVVIPVPESARTAAQSMAQVLGIPCREGLVKSRYIGRTFIMARDKERRRSVRHKLNAIPLEFNGKRVLLLDDSIVRGHTGRELVRMAREAGAKKVYLASYSPPLCHPCPYGIDMSTRREFIARDRSHEELTEELGCDHLLYQDLQGMIDATRAGNQAIEKFCTACFDGDYPTGDITAELLQAIEGERIKAQI
ncbi:MAG: amidophosphoribosyltransferase [Planctomycetota bacterium]